MRNNYYRYFQKQWVLCLLVGVIPMLASAQDLTLQTAEVLSANLEEDDLSKNLFSETDIQGNVYLAGMFRGSTNFDLQGGNVTRSSKGGRDGFIAKYTATGELVYVVQIGGEEDDQISGMTVNPSTGVAYVVGEYKKAASFGSDFTINDNINSSTDGFIVSISPSGSVSLIDRVGGKNFQSVEAVVLDGAGRIYIAGRFSLELRFDSSSNSEDIPITNGSDVFIASYETSGVQSMQIVAARGEDNETVNNIFLDDQNAITAVGNFVSETMFDPESNASVTSEGENDVYMAKYTSQGKFTFVRTIQGSGNIALKGADTDENHNVYLGGRFESDILPEGSSEVIDHGNNQDIFLVKYDKNGAFRNKTAITGNGYDEPRDLKFSDNRVYLTGLFQNDLFEGDLNAENNLDVFLATFNTELIVQKKWAFTGNGRNQGGGITNSLAATYLSGFVATQIKLDPNSSQVTGNSSGKSGIFLAKYINSNALPQITDVTREEGKLTIVGSNFTNNLERITVLVENSEGALVTTSDVSVNGAGTEISATASGLVAGEYTVQVIVSGEPSNEVSLVVPANPEITSVTVNENLLTITGANFKSATESTTVTLMDENDNPVTVSDVTVNDGGTEITATATLGEGTYQVIVGVGDLESTPFEFSVDPDFTGPDITDATIESGVLTITGTNLGSDTFPPSVVLTYGESTTVSLTNVEYNSDGTQVTASVASEEPGSYTVDITVNDISDEFTFTLDATTPDPPVITDAFIQEGALTVKGSNLGSDAFPPTVTLNYEVNTSIPLTEVTYNEAGTQITANVASEEVGDYSVVVTVNSKSAQFSFSIVSEGDPTISNALWNENDQLIIEGENFGSDNSIITVRILGENDNVLAEFTEPTLNESGTEIQVTPEEPLSPGDYVVQLIIADTELQRSFIVPDEAKSPPVIEVSFQPLLEEGIASADVSIEVTDDKPGTTVTLYYLGIRDDPASVNWQEQAVGTTSQANETLTATLNETDFDELGLQFYMEALDSDGLTNTAIQINRIYRSYSDTQPLRASILKQATEPFDNQDYQLISLPLQVDNIATAFEEFGAADPKVWRIFRLQSGQYQEFGRAFKESPSWSGATQLGQGYMLIYKPDTSVAVEGSVANVRLDEPVSITLEPKANFIGNPYTFPVNWDDVIAHNENLGVIVKGIKKFNGNFAQENTSATLNPFEGALIFNDSEQSVEIEIPIGTSSTTGSRSEKNSVSNKLSSPNWKMPLQLGVDGSQTMAFGGIGMHEQAHESADRMDDYTPPRLSDYVEMNFTHPEFFMPNFAVDIVPPATEHIWPLEVATSFNGKPHTISWEPINTSGQDDKLFLVDKTNGQVVDMDKKTSYSFTVNGTHALEIMLGSEEMLADHLGEAFMSVGAPYPNPVVETLYIPVYSSSAETVTVRVFDATGHLLELKEYALSRGAHELAWEIKQTSQKQGLYLYQVSTSSKLLGRGKIVVQ
uniref:T9SS type A sorting domain-containing protein n=1 Tax=Roseihalotalea indica TaxID=2867963 RepID=A0AA49GKX8_9BACT|nr:T9SS type A sorting domain-containing protein [Tunicatimonas sp. TK19036]